MKRLFSIFVFVELALASSAWAQFTNVTGTVVDPDAVPYAFGTISATLQTSASPTLNGLAYSPPTQPAGLDGTGKFLMRLADNTQLLPAGTKWGFTICSAVGTVSPAFGTASQCFTVAPITISGSSQDITATITAVPVPRLTVPFGAAGGVASVSGSAPITSTGGVNPVIGCSTCVTAPAGSNTQVQFNDAGAFGGDAGFTFNKATGTVGIQGPAANDYSINLTGQSGGGSGVAPITIHTIFAVGEDFYTHSNTTNRAPFINMLKSRGTQGAPTALTFTGFELDSGPGLNFGGYDGTSYVKPASIFTFVDENWDATHHGMSIHIYGTAPAGNTQEIAQFGGVDGQGFGGANIVFFRPLTWNSNQAANAGIFPSASPAKLAIRTADNSADAALTVGNLTVSGTCTGCGGTVNNATQFSLPYYSAAGSANTLSGVAGPTTPNGVPQFWTTTPSGGVATAPAPQLAGVPVNAQTGASYTFVATDRASEVTASNAGASAYTLPQANSAGFTSNFVAALTNIGAGLVTLTPTVSTVNGAATQIVPQNWHSFIYSDNTNYRMPVMPTISAFTNCTDSGGNHLNFTAATGAFSCGTTSSTTGTTINPTNNVIPRRSNATTFVDSALTDNGTNVTSSEAVLFPAGTASLPGIAFSAQANTGFWRAGSGVFDFSNAGTTVFELGGALAIKSSTVLGFTSGDPSSQPLDTGLSRVSAGLFAFGNGSAADTTATIKFKAGRSDSNCQNSGGTCGSAMSGMVTIAAGATTVTVATTAITTNAEVFLQEDSSLGTQLGVTCNTAVARSYQITTRTSGTSFVITSSAAPITNPACLQYFIWNTGS